MTWKFTRNLQALLKLLAAVVTVSLASRFTTNSSYLDHDGRPPPSGAKPSETLLPLTVAVTAILPLLPPWMPALVRRCCQSARLIGRDRVARASSRVVLAQRRTRHQVG